MKTPRTCSGCLLILLAALGIISVTGPECRADLAFTISIDQFGSPAESNLSYAIFPGLSTTNVPITYYEVYSPSSNSYTGVGTGAPFNVGSLPDFDAVRNELTNGVWTLVLNAGDPSQKVYTFKATLSNFSSNAVFPNIDIFNPPDGSTNVPLSNTVYTFTGPSTWPTLDVYLDQGNNYFDSATLASSATNWTSSRVFQPATSYTFLVTYYTDGSPFVSFSVPTTTNSQTAPGWSSSTQLYMEDSVQFTTTNVPVSHKLMAHYAFDADDLSDPFDSSFLHDTSGYNNDISGPSSLGGNYPQPTSDDIAGSSGVSFDGTGYYDLPTNLLPVIAGSYTLSLWLKTSQTNGLDTDNGYDDPAIVWAGGVGDNYFDSEPMTLTGSKLGFYTGANSYDTLHSSTSINSGSFTHLVVTRDISTGQKQIFINGNADATDIGDTSLLSDSTEFVLGVSIYHGGVAGIVDDVQLYQGVLASSDINTIYNNPGTTIQDTSSISLQEALDAPNLTWTTSGDAPWLGEADTSYDGVSAAQSDVLTDGQTAVLQTTVTGPGTLSFYWQTVGESDDFDLEFDDNGSYVNDIPSQTSWDQFTYEVPSGTHTLTWTAIANDSPSPDDAAFLDQVSYVPVGGTGSPAGSWATTGSMITDRGEFTLTVLRNGKVLAAGGLIEGFPEASTSAADLYNPATGTWTNTGYMNTDRRGHTATLMPNGQVLVTGGVSELLNGPRVNSAEFYDPVAQTWSNTASMQSARVGHTATLLANGLVLVAGGGTNTSELFNPATQTWTTTGLMNESRMDASAFLLSSGKVLVQGGASDNTAELYDPGTGHWTFANMLKEQDSSTATQLGNGTVLVAGGAISSSLSGYTEIYNSTNNAWAQTGSMNVGRTGATSVLLANGQVLAAGGQGNSGVLAGAELYNPATGTWSVTGSMLEAKEDFNSILLPDGRVLVTGGFSATAELYTTTGSFILLKNFVRMPSGAFQFGFTNTPGSTNIVFASTNAAMPFASWTSLGAATETSSGNFQFTDTAAAGLSRRFYRVRSP